MSRFSVVESVRHLIAEYRSFIKSSYRLADPRLPAPEAQYEIRNDSGDLLTIPDFAYLDRKIAIYCDGFAYHGNVDSLAGDAKKRNALQASGWAVLTFWGRQILRNPGACEAQIWQCYMYRHSSADMAPRRSADMSHSVGPVATA